ncbi:uncharacterized protein N7473_001930 [Penicillium subrubescens]|uniref:uncharacterized protein n=1 Tax=Penicillium subrubescens TaxID=1316194 RepID=UPI002545B4A8|nr:uncharacterized protein N7473_001930 [Penicillium subrubescens]KAJ5905014.1 hypothetical protein N7473_001930 [Penicillium subrubescens]
MQLLAAVHGEYQSVLIDQEGRQDAHQTNYPDTFLEDAHDPEWLVDHVTGDLPSFQLSPSLARTPNFMDAGQPPNARHPMQGVFADIVSDPAAVEPSAFLDSLTIPRLADLSSPESSIQYPLRDLIRVLEQYPRNLLRDDFTPPSLHRSLYDENVPDIATLARTSMAVCCGSAMETAEGARFAKHAMEVERQRLIASYRTYSCMHQWDALHAMLVYSVLELRASLAEGNDGWKQKSCSKGLKAPFLVKMTRDFIRSHTVPEENLTAQAYTPVQSFQQWATTETARRTIFLANIVHFLSNHDPETGEPSPYYEPLDDELVLSMPLPSAHTMWAARTEQEWRQAMKSLETASSPDGEYPSSEVHPAQKGLTLGYYLSEYPHETLHNYLKYHCGLGSTDELRSFIVLCALKQFDHIQPSPSS